MFAEIGGIFFLFSTTLIYLMKPLAHFGLTMHLMHYFFFAKDSTMKVFEYDEEERQNQINMPEVFEGSTLAKFIKSNFKIKLNLKKYLKLLCLTQYCYDCWCFKR